MKLFSNAILLLICAYSVTSIGCKSDPVEPARDKFLGTYLLSELCSGDPDNFEYPLEVKKDPESENAVLIYGIYDLEKDAEATISGKKITIPQQKVEGVDVSGSGEINDNILTLEYFVEEEDVTRTCNAVCTKQ